MLQQANFQNALYGRVPACLGLVLESYLLF
jgi:hypothetical protein